ncbi:MAG: C25 family peptidase propeptide domain-containing protein, partial [Ignavibacteriaceae bacterium]
MHSIFRYVFQILIISLTFTFLSSAQNFKIIESTLDHIIIEFNFNNFYSVYDTLVDGRKYNVIKGDENYYRNPGEPWLPLINLSIGIPHDSNPTMKILRNDKLSYSNKFIMPYPETDPLFEEPDVQKINEEIYSKSNFFPNEVVQISSSYDFRYAKILPIAVSPYQFNPVTRELV